MLYKLASFLLRAAPGSKARSVRREYRDLARLREADVAFVSFPKSGRTFVRAMLARLYQQQFGIDERGLLDFSTLRAAPPEVPRILFTHDNDAMRAPSEIHIDADAYEGRKIVFQARHPGDIAVSRYYHLKHRSRDSRRRRLADQPIDDFVWTEHGGIPSIVRFLNAWAELARRRPATIIVRYEDFIADPKAALRDLAAFVGLGSTEKDFDEAVESARFERLRAKEQQGYFSSDRLRARSATLASSKVRAGGTGGYRKVLSEANAARIDAYIEAHLDPVFGYGSPFTRNSGEDRRAGASG